MVFAPQHDNWGNNWGNRPITFRLHSAEGDVALVAAVGLIGDGAGNQALGQQRIQVLPGRLLLRIAQETADLGDASRLIHAEKKNLILYPVRNPVAGNRRNHRGIPAVMPVDKGRRDIQIDPKRKDCVRSAVPMALR